MLAASSGRLVDRPEWKPTTALQVGASPGQLERHRPAEAVADGRHPGRVGLARRPAARRGRPADGPASRAGRRPAAVKRAVSSSGGQHLPVAVVVEGERHVAELGQAPGRALRVVAQPVALVADEDGGPPPAAARRPRRAGPPAAVRRAEYSMSAMCTRSLLSRSAADQRSAPGRHYGKCYPDLVNRRTNCRTRSRRARARSTHDGGTRRNRVLVHAGHGLGDLGPVLLARRQALLDLDAVRAARRQAVHDVARAVPIEGVVRRGDAHHDLRPGGVVDSLADLLPQLDRREAADENDRLLEPVEADGIGEPTRHHRAEQRKARRGRSRPR